MDIYFFINPPASMQKFFDNKNRKSNICKTGKRNLYFGSESKKGKKYME